MRQYEEEQGSDVPNIVNPPPLGGINNGQPLPAPPGPQASLPTSVMESIYHPNYNPTAMGGPTTPETPEEARARQALIDKLNSAPGEDLIAEPAVGAINEGQPLPPPAVSPPPAPVVTPPPAPLETQTIDGPRSPLESYTQYQGPTARSHFGGNIFQRIGIPHERHIGGPGLMGPLDPLRQDFPKAGGGYYSNKDKTRRGDYKFSEHERMARNVGRGVGAGAGFVLGGGPVGAALLAPVGGKIGRWGARIADPNRSLFERWLGNRDPKKNKKKSDEELQREFQQEMRSQQQRSSFSEGGGSLSGISGGGGMFGGGFGGYGGGSYGGYGGYGGGYGRDSVGGAYKNR